MSKLSKKDIIFRAAARLFKEHGYQASSMRQLAKEVGLEVSSLYSHISSKQELLVEICMSQAQKYSAYLKDVMDSEEGCRDILRAMSYYHIEMAVEDSVSATVFNDEWKYLEEPTLSAFKSIRKEYESRLLDVIRQGVEEGTLIDEDPFIIYQTYLSSFKWIYIINKPGKNLDKKALQESISSIILKGISK